MRVEVLALALIVGLANYVFRYGPIGARLGAGQAGGAGWIARFLAATGPAAIATLVVASVLPLAGADRGPLVAGVAGVLALWVWRRSVVLATLGGAAAYGLVFAVSA
ncbi:L-valine transporter subunit YgaH [Gemmobacter aquarius]|uniref:L-valine transporter subunit YgaH n=1 Tax=Paragemmobacter aquarius TaxID=2169400 RepID=A0A2S0UNK6_9RHOB|nr:AzlD domain-containing protein [Gemmobacter aquarius]AWB49399.1 L-valine transporter subunit YgaH [Gemmobacter aquarius]